MRKNHINLPILATILLCSLSGSLVFAQTKKTTTPMKTQKYNGYGLPNTKFRKIKVDMTKKQSETKASPSIATEPVTLTPKSSMQPNNVSVSAATPAAKAEKFVKFSLDYDISYNTQAEKQADGSRSEYISHNFIPKVSIGNYNIFGDIYYNDDIKSPSANEWQDSALVVNRKAFEWGRYVTFTPAGLFVFPLQKSSREDAGIKYAFGPIGTFGLNTKNMGLDALTLNYYLAYAKYVTEFKTKPNGDPSADYRIRQRINFGYQFTDWLSFKSRFQFDSGYSNQGVVKNAYLHYEALEFQITEKISTYIMHATASGVYTISEAGGDILFENDLKFYDPKNSELAIGLTLSF